MTDTQYTIGEGVQVAMYNAGDAPRSDELYEVSEAGHTISKTYGRDAIYYWYEEDGAVRRTPFR
jgi:hypothetical protein